MKMLPPSDDAQSISLRDFTQNTGDEFSPFNFSFGGIGAKDYVNAFSPESQQFTLNPRFENTMDAAVKVADPLKNVVSTAPTIEKKKSVLPLIVGGVLIAGVAFVLLKKKKRGK